MRLHNHIAKDLQTKIYLRKEALKSLPDSFRVQAEIIDHTPPPSDRPFPFADTAPIKDFDASMYAEDEQEQAKTTMRTVGIIDILLFPLNKHIHQCHRAMQR
jgi:hypothetical protein